ncbi:copper homeostasis protein CutC [Miniphocaeibacter massiliensis]|uniref:copper homeostasis protein CutC n=1 Tax=Miniphocaeibacter massiliensis TaxID=2041841 RepID=UPI001A923AAB|nr:copper homeostasis protein CutC [Miniphocaeibacter massiliensis]
MNEKIIEICCGSYEDAYIAKKSGADQIELNSALFLGGLTPSYGTTKLVLDNLNIPTFVMIRPRPGGFLYNNFEYESIVKDTELFLDLNIEGIVFGFLSKDNEIDLDKTKTLVNLIHSKGKLAVFHRAFDQVNNPIKSIEELISLSVDRILTSGQKNNALDGIGLLNELQENYSNKIELIVGSGVNSENVKTIYGKTSISKFHSTCKAWRKDPTTIAKISYSYADNEHKDMYDITDFETAKNFVKTINSIVKI